MNIHVICVGAPKESFYVEAAAEYEKRLKAYCRVNTVQIKDERLSDKPSEAEISAALKKEGEKILAALPSRAYKIAMCVEGKQMPSEKFADMLHNAANNGFSDIAFVIGGSFGLHEDVKSACDYRLSVSQMTFPHRMMKFILLEQIYRAMNILGGGKYHK